LFSVAFSLIEMHVQLSCRKNPLIDSNKSNSHSCGQNTLACNGLPKLQLFWTSKTALNKSIRADSGFRGIRKPGCSLRFQPATSRHNHRVQTRAEGTAVSVVAGVSADAASPLVSSAFALESATASLNMPPKCGQ